ncbi:hypothetical protein QQ054_24270 [Oscillatoria amoena NRMC-F 0135]|nr:hypothetical protein [Oscillatoria laete-virens]MDL5049133.1 hypothetical protein [Oscillatoria amoena NRMC-F 0135]MDL5052200.1 hypothetical protein [Oscillatoria laete-virens NRMC-F 0139]
MGKKFMTICVATGFMALHALPVQSQDLSELHNAFKSELGAANLDRVAEEKAQKDSETLHDNEGKSTDPNTEKGNETGDVKQIQNSEETAKEASK